MTRLSVNLNKIAVLRNSRGGVQPDPLDAAGVCLAAGAQGITLHPRPDQRHVRTDDVLALARLLEIRQAQGVELNLEGNPFAAPRPHPTQPQAPAYPGLLTLCLAARPAQVTLVPDGDGQITSDHGFDLQSDIAGKLQMLIPQYRAIGCRVSLFMDVETRAEDFQHARALGAERVELYTGPYAQTCHDAQTPAGRQAMEASLRQYAQAAQRARDAGLQVNAGHDLDQKNLGALCAAIPWLAEVSIGHALIGEALYAGLDATVRAYRDILARS